MSQVLIVMGMNSRRLPRAKFEHAYKEALLKLLEQPAVGLQARAPRSDEIKLLYWTDLIPEPPRPSRRAPPVRLASSLFSLGDLPSLADLRDTRQYVQRTLRRRALVLDQLGEYNPWLEAPTPLGRALRPLFIQTLLYTHDVAAVRHEERSAGPGLREQVQARLAKLLTPDTQLVIGHSLGSVIAYEGLRRNAHRVDTLVTLGSPAGMRRMVYEPLGRSLREPAPYAWPEVRRWCNVSCASDVLFVPELRLRGLFRGPIEELCVEHGAITKPDLTHRLQSYLSHVEVGRVLARAWERCLRTSVSVTTRPSVATLKAV